MADGEVVMKSFEGWLERRGGTGLFVRTKDGGRQFLAGGDVAPFMSVTINRFVETGRASRVGNRVTLVP